MTRLAALAAALLLVLVAAAPAMAGLADRVAATFGLMSADLVKAFEPLDAIVVAVDGNTVYLDHGEKAGVQVGQEFTVYRKGAAFYHPYTGKILGHYEDVLGYAHVRQVAPEFAVATFVPREDAPTPRPEDGARISHARIKIAVTPVLDLTDGHADVRRVPYLLASALQKSKRFHVIDPLSVTDMFASGSVRVEEVLSRPERAMRAAKNLEIAIWVVPVIIQRRGAEYLDVTCVSAVTGAALFSRRQPLLPAASGEDQRFPWEPRTED